MSDKELEKRVAEIGSEIARLRAEQKKRDFEYQEWTKNNSAIIQEKRNAMADLQKIQIDQLRAGEPPVSMEID